MADISKVTLPNGQTYDIKDAVARAAMGAGSMKVVWTKTQYSGSTAPSTADKAQIPDAAYAYYNGGTASASGTLVAANASVNQFYLVAGHATDPSGSTKGGDYYDEWVVVDEGGTKKWEKLGDTQFTGDLSLASASFIKTLETGQHSHKYDKTTSVTISSGATGDITVATGSLTTDAAVALASSSNTSTGSVKYVQQIEDVAAQGHTHTVDVTVPEKKIYVSSTGGGVSGGGYSNPTSETFAKSINTATGTVTAASTNAVATLTPTSKRLDTTSIYPAKSISTSAFVTSGTTTRFGTGNALTSVSGTVTAVPSRSSATVATGSITADNTNGTVLTGASFANTVKVVTATTSTSVVTGGSVQPAVLVSASVNESTETLVLSTGPQTAISSTNISVPSTMSTPEISVTKGKPATTTVYSADAPESISVAVTSTAASFIKSSTVTSGGQEIITAVNNASTTIDVRDTAATVATGTVNTEGSGAAVVISVASTAAKYLTGLSGSTTFVTVASVNSSASALTGLGTQGSYSFTAPTVTLSTGENTNAISVGADGTISGISIASTATAKATVTTRYLTASVSQQPVLATTKISAAPNSTPTNTDSVSTVIGSSTEGYAITSVGLS